jgi:hypothetical protein
MNSPTAVRRSRLAAAPALAWPHVAHSRFIAAYCGAQWPDAALDHATVLHGRDRDGHALTLQVAAAEPPAGLSLILRGSTGAHALHLALAACEGGSRLTITHEPLAGDGPAQAPADTLAALLAAPLPSALRVAAVADAEALAAAQAYLAGTAHAVDALRVAMAPSQGYAQPARGGFSLAAQVWHLADVEEFGWSQRLRRMLAEHEPVLEGVDGDRLAVERRYQQRPWRGAALRFVRLRRVSLQVLARFDAAVLARPLQFGGTRINAGELLAAMLAHDHEHRLEMAALWPPAAAARPMARGTPAAPQQRRTQRL